MHTRSLLVAGAVAIAALGCQDEPTAPPTELRLIPPRLHARSKAGSMSCGLTLRLGTVRRRSNTSSLTDRGMAQSSI